MIELRGITKYFHSNGVVALDHASLNLLPGEIHALLGENGAGKSTFMHILAGYEFQDGGRIFVDGKRRRFKSSADALAAGIGMVRQHPHTLNGFKVWEDCVLGAEKPRSQVAKAASEWGFDLPLDDTADSLGVSQRQLAAILALILRDVRYFIFDEPAAVLTSVETAALFEVMQRLKEAGRGIVLISHKLNETLTLADRVTVIRRGKTFGSRDASSVSTAELEDMIFGKEKKIIAEKKQFSLNFPANAEPVLSVEDLSVDFPGKPSIRNISLELTPGKIVGITGVLDSGLETLELALAGFHGRRRSFTLRHKRSNISGSIRIRGRDIDSVRSFREAGGAYLGADRLGKNLMPVFPLRESLIIHAHRRSRKGFWGRFGIMDKKNIDSFCAKVMNRADVERKVVYRADSFSGGMLQRILLAREFEEDPSLFILAGGSWGLDQQNREKFAAQLRTLVNGGTKTGKAALLFSFDPESLFGMADEIFVLRNGSFSARVSLEQETETAIREIHSAMVGSISEKAEQL